MAATMQKPKRQDPVQDESEADNDFYSDEDYSDEDDYTDDDYYTDEEEEIPRQNQPQAQRQPQAQQKQDPKKFTSIWDQPKKQEDSPFAEGGSRAMQPFEHIGPPSTSMAGPVTYARAQRGEIPLREGNPNQKLATGDKMETSAVDDQDGLKLKLELNLDIEVELKATIHGDLTLALLS